MNGKKTIWHQPIIEVLADNKIPKIAYTDEISAPFGGKAKIYYEYDEKTENETLLRIDFNIRGDCANGKCSKKWNKIKLSARPTKQLKNIFFQDDRIKVRIFGTQNQIVVWQELAKLSSGQTISYKDLAVKAFNDKKKARALGNMVGANPIPWFIPCHRVLSSAKTLGGFSSGLTNKIEMLEVEAV